MEVIPMKKIICNKCEYYLKYDGEDEAEYCTTQENLSMLYAYEHGQSDYDPRLIPQSKCKDFRKKPANSRIKKNK